MARAAQRRGRAQRAAAAAVSVPPLIPAGATAGMAAVVTAVAAGATVEAAVAAAAGAWREEDWMLLNRRQHCFFGLWATEARPHPTLGRAVRTRKSTLNYHRKPPRLVSGAVAGMIKKRWWYLVAPRAQQGRRRSTLACCARPSAAGPVVN